MIYQSNLPQYPEAFESFRHLSEYPRGHSMGHSVPSDWLDKSADDPLALYKLCGCWTRDERAILAACARQFLGGTWVDLGCHTGLTSKTINWMTNAPVVCVDPMLTVYEFRRRFQDNTGFPLSWTQALTSNDFFRHLANGIPEYCTFSGFCVDADHEPGKPLEDVQNAAKHLASTGVIMLHDGIGRPVREAVEWLMDNGFKARVFWTPHVVFCCWRGDFTPPDHTPDPEVKRQLTDGRMSDFDFTRLW